MIAEMKRRQFLRALAMTTGGIVLAACAPKAEPTATAMPKAQPTMPPVQAKPAGKEPVVLQLHLRAGGEKSEAPLYVGCPGLLTEQYPYIKVELAPIPGGEFEAKVQTMAAAKTLGDVMWTAAHSGYHQRLIRQGIIAVSDERLDAHGYSKDEWVPASIAPLTYEGKMYGLPKNCHPGAAHIWINEDMFQAAGLPVPEIYDHTHAEIFEWAKAMAKGPETDREVYGYTIRGNNFEFIYDGIRAFGGWEYNEEGTESLVDSDQARQWAVWANSCYRAGLIPLTEALPTGGEAALFAAQKVPMVCAGRWIHKSIQAAVKEAGDPFKWSVIQAPRESNANGWIGIIATHSATTFSKHPEEAFLLSYYMANQPCAELQMTELGYLTARVDDIKTIEKLGNDPFLKLQYDNNLLEEPSRIPKNTRELEARTVLQNEMQRIWLGDVEPTAETMKKIKEAVQSVVDKPY
ncbi:MAG: extracellular solute-binding protein [Chloroflexi bacterium]|nr:extracellular solute-binding protein [Chloroflexota bacterium]